MAPGERVVYFADTAYFPYGPRPAAEVRKRAFAAVHRLVQARAKMVIVACNTASAAALDDLREMFDIPFVGMVPGLKPAAATSRSGVVAILATPGTLDGALYARVAEEFGRGTTVLNVAGYRLAELVERGALDGPATRAALRDALAPAVERGADVVVLGCTHYHFLAPAIAAEFPSLRIVDTAEPVARRAAAVLQELGLAAQAGSEGHLDLIVTGDREAFRATMERLGFAPAGVPA
jgi:glutamate racemase